MNFNGFKHNLHTSVQHKNDYPNSPYYTADVTSSVATLTGGKLADRVIVPTPAASAMNEAQHLAGPHATVVYFTNSGKDILIPPGALESARIIEFSRLGSNVFPQAEKIANSGLIDLKKVITHRFKFEELPQAMTFMASADPKKLKAVISLDG